MRTLLIVYHSMTGGTEQMVHAAAEGASDESSLHVKVLRAVDARPDDVLAADGYIFATPENLAAVSGLLKDFFDRTHYAALDRINGRPYATLVCAGSDGQNAVRQIERIATGWRLKEVTPALVVCTHRRRRRFCEPSGSRHRTWRTAAKWVRQWPQAGCVLTRAWLKAISVSFHPEDRTHSSPAHCTSRQCTASASAWATRSLARVSCAA